MGNLSSYCSIISKLMYPLILPKMAPFCMKITKKFLGQDPRPLQLELLKIILYFVYILIKISKLPLCKIE